MSSATKPPVLAESSREFLRLLVVSKEPAVVRALASLGEGGGWLVEVASSGWDAMERLEAGGSPELLLLDVPHGNGDSFHTLRWLRRLSPDVPVVAICDAEDSLMREEAMRLGAEKILGRPLDPPEVLGLMQEYGGAASCEREGDDPQWIDPKILFAGSSPLLQKLRGQAELLAHSDVPVFLVGERGSGKGAVARLIHQLSAHSGSRFLHVNCATLPQPRMERELFSAGMLGVNGGNGEGDAGRQDGTVKGTIFLEEVAAMPADLQGRLFEHLQSPGVRNEARNEAVRIVSGSSENIEEALGKGRLREDLYHRLSAFTLQVPPLRQRREEIPALLVQMMRKLASHHGMAAREFPSAMLDACRQYEWPGNLGELQALVKRYLLTGETFLGAANAVPYEISGTLPGGLHLRPAVAVTDSQVREADAAPAAPRSLKSMIQDIKSDAEQKAIRAALERTGWNRKAAARLLRVSYRTLLYKIEQYQMKASEPYFSVPFEEIAGKGNGRG